MTPVELSRTVLCAVRRAVDAGELSVAVPARAVVAPPGPGGCGDYATNVALQLARPAGRLPRHVAEILRPLITEAEGVARVEITGPGFLNITLDGGAEALVRDILRRGPRYGHAEEPSGQVVQLHHPCDVRAAVTGQVLARILRSQGALVHTSCETEPDPAWAEPLGVTVDSHSRPGTPAPFDVNPRPVPAPEAPTLLDVPLRPVPAPEASAPLAVTVDTHSRPGSPARVDVTPRPAPAPEAPTPLDITLHPTPAPNDPTPLGPDAARWALLHPAPHDRPRITADHLVQRESNPLFRVRYAHARARALSRNAADLGFDSAPSDVRPERPERSEHPDNPRHPDNPHHPDHAGPPPLLTALAAYPPALATAATRHAPDHLARHLVVIADAFLRYQEVTRVLPLGDEKPSAAHRARLALAEAAGTVLAGGLTLLGIDAPEHL
ncbi:ArgS-related anticodon-binding protein NrtL [Streptomyces sp. CA-288835]|uniref:ArgS-related anticodon-binding protein NrtL n=1 Tax=Streptomyces sp. CA-288835 TaxID=3240069 RepID=UPI003D8E83A5